MPFDSFRFEACDLVVLSTVAFRTGSVFSGLEEVDPQLRIPGARKVLLDVYHHAGVLPLDLGALDADFAVGGSYKYLRGGPGACWLYVHPRHHGLRTLDTGWFAKKDVFAYERPEPPRFAAGGDAWLESTPAGAGALPGARRPRDHARARGGAHPRVQPGAESGLESLLPVQGEGDDHGAFVTLGHPNAKVLRGGAREEGVKTDARGEYLRICPDFLNSREELQTAAAHVAELIERERI